MKRIRKEIFLKMSEKKSNYWQIIVADDFELPSAPTVTVVQQHWKRFVRLLGLQPKEPEKEKNNATELKENKSLNRKPALSKLEEYFREWEKKEESTVCFLLDPPFSGVNDIARDWAKKHKWKSLKPPDKGKIKNKNVDGWWKEQKTKGQWFIDDFTRYFIRTADGLSFIRTLLPGMIRGDFGQGLVVCDSWMFVFLQRIWPFISPKIYCFAAAGPELLKQAGIHAPEKDLRKLAAYVRGNAGIALAVWSVEQDKDKKLPELPAGSNDTTAFILYSILLHRGLGSDLLQEILSTISSEELNVKLLQLEQYGILQNIENQWKIDIHAYLAVRDFLSSRDFLLDGF